MWNLLIKSLLRSKGIGLAIFSIALIVSSIIATTSVMNSIILQNENISKLSYSNNQFIISSDNSTSFLNSRIDIAKIHNLIFQNITKYILLEN